MGKVAPKATDEESPIYDYCMALAECGVQSAECKIAFPKTGEGGFAEGKDG
ncbi:MAG: hypothetical protein IJW65_02535 [Clostridia bacterium]|nr:hypothetical protein [Clostridia bacterium]